MKFLNLQQQLELRKAAGENRQRRIINSAQQTQTMLGTQVVVNFSSNDYLGLANSHNAKRALSSHCERYGFGSGASHMICGHQQAHENLEIALAEFIQRDAALTFTCGYMANLAIIQSLSSKNDVIIADKLNHASLIDGVQLSQAASQRYPHCDLTALETRLKKSSQNKFVVTDSVFSMDGDIAPLPDIVGLCEKYQAILIVDDAHGFGVLGTSGQGCCEYYNLNQKQLPVVMSTLGKALGGFGAFVSGEKVLIDYLMQFARSYIYTTAMPSAVAQANLANLETLKSQPFLIEKLNNNIQLFKRLCADNDITLIDSSTAIQPVLIGHNEKTMAVFQSLMEQGILVGAIRPPTVPPNSARLRVTLSAAHTEAEIFTLVQSLKNSLNLTEVNS
ncbi:8-amino-7-oxononanoate synthase [Aliikangiella sp. IMCC44359]|uniref:8-amino-7-oxononanoate synthase n=1 Tax=Aliikangiella sp. IMCC44359 TaxID=3459125 RepID=UPI00403AA62B